MRCTLLALALLTSACPAALTSTGHHIGTAEDAGSAPPQPDLAAAPDLLSAPPPADLATAPPPVVTGPADAPVVYPSGQRHAPITQALIDRWRALIKPTRVAKNFVRLGDNLSHEVHLLGCADKAHLSSHTELQPTVDYFDGGNIKGGTPFAYVRDLENYSTDAALSGSPDLQAQEIATGNPAYALVMFGSLDLQWAGVFQADPATDAHVIDRFGPNMLAIVDELIAAGVLPLIRTIAPEAQSNHGPWNRRVTMVNALTRAVAAGRQVPFADFWLDAQHLPPEGYWSDGLHLASAPTGVCDFTALSYGDNLMSLVALEELDRVRRAVVAGEVPDPNAATLAGDGTRAQPFVAAALPFGTLGKLEAGGERIYRVSVTATTKVRVMLFDPKASPVATTVQHEIAGVKKRADATLLALELAPGTHDFVITGTPAVAAEFGFAIDLCDAADSACVPDP
jgi:hypothetical protein